MPLAFGHNKASEAPSGRGSEPTPAGPLVTPKQVQTIWGLALEIREQENDAEQAEVGVGVVMVSCCEGVGPAMFCSTPEAWNDCQNTDRGGGFAVEQRTAEGHASLHQLDATGGCG